MGNLSSCQQKGHIYHPLGTGKPSLFFSSTDRGMRKRKNKCGGLSREGTEDRDGAGDKS